MEKSNPPLHYDIFISHSHANKEWASKLADRLAAEHYNGRLLRPWMDYQYIDPGDLASNAELTTALDRSRKLGLVLSPAALDSSWVQFELDYFLKCRNSDDIIVILQQDCTLPASLSAYQKLDFRFDDEFEEQFSKLIALLCPATEVDLEEVAKRIDAAFGAHILNDPGEYAPGPTLERDLVFQELSRYDIDNGGYEGIAIAAFERAATHVVQLADRHHPAAYNTKMLVGECLAAALTRSFGYRQILQRYLDISELHLGDPVLLFVVARAFSKLAEFAPHLVDTGMLLRLAGQLDAKTEISDKHKAIETLLGRTLGKLRDTPTGDLLIKTLIEGGRSSRIAAFDGISLTYHRGNPVFYISELKRVFDQHDAEEVLHHDPPSKRVLGLFFASDLDQPEDVKAALKRAKQDLERDFPGIEFPYGYSWLGLRPKNDVKNTHLAPFIGTVVKVTVDNMIETSVLGNTMSTVACFTEARIVEALFQRCGAFLIQEQAVDSHQCRRLRSRGIPYAMVSKETMALIESGDAIVVDGEAIRIWSRSNEPTWPTPKERKRKKRKTKTPEPQPLLGATKLMRESIQPHLEIMARHLDAPLRLGIDIESEGYEPSSWMIVFKSGTVSVVEEEPRGLNVVLHIDIHDCVAFITQKLSWDNVMQQVYGDTSFFSMFFDAWNSAVQERTQEDRSEKSS